MNDVINVFHFGFPFDGVQFVKRKKSVGICLCYVLLVCL